jgi:hypothetical protein
VADVVEDLPRKSKAEFKTPKNQQTKHKGGGMVQVIQHFLSMPEALGSIPSNTHTHTHTVYEYVAK